MKTHLEFLVVMALVVCSISFTVSFTGIFKPVRELLSRIHPKVEELIHCPYCFGHWVTFAVLGIVNDWIPFTKIGFIDYLLTAFAIMALAGLGHYVLLRAYKPVHEEMAYREIEKLKRKNNGNK